MCGITGFSSPKHFYQLSASLPDASSRLTHRGPDDCGLFVDETAGIGMAHRRLSVIDLTENGRQPMANDNGTIHIVYNGEVYNYRQIRSALISLGHHFRSESDTEVILKAYEQWGRQCFEKFVGMFALAIWDGNQQQLVLARDRLGIKPLYFHHTSEHFLFASELKAMLAFNRFSPTIDPEAQSLFLHYQYVPAPKTIFKNTYKLLPGHVCIVSHHQVSTDRFWDIPDIPLKNELHETEALDRLEVLLTQSVTDRMISDVPLGALLSGGIDSSLVVALMQKVSDSPVRTFTIGFAETAYDEAPWAAKIANYLETDHTELFVTPQTARDVISNIPDVYDEPFADISAIPTILVSKLARSEVTVALSGDGGDEQFAGYVRYWTTRSLINSMKYFPPSIAGFVKKIPPQLLFRFYRPLLQFFPQQYRIENFYDKWEKFLYLLDQRQLKELYRMTICLWTSDEISALTGKNVPFCRYDTEFDRNGHISDLSRMMRVDMKTYLPDAMLTKVDRASMASGLEVRVPLLDHRVVAYTMGLPDRFKYSAGTGKYLLQKLLARYLPPELFVRPKMGFGVPMGIWFRKELKEFLLDYLSPSRLRRTGWFNPSYVEQKIDEHMSGRINHQYRLWSLLVWEMWAERWVSG